MNKQLVDDAIKYTDTEVAGAKAYTDGKDAETIHKNVSGEIAAITEKTSPVNADLLLIEDSEDSNNKKKVIMSDFQKYITHNLYTKIINGEAKHFNADGFNWIEFSTFASSNCEIAMVSNKISLYSNNGSGSCTITTDYKRLKNYILSIVFQFDDNTSGDYAEFHVYFNRNLSGEFYTFIFQFNNGTCTQWGWNKDGGTTTFYNLVDSNGSPLTLNTLTNYKVDIVSHGDGTADLYLDGVLQVQNSGDVHTLTGMDYTWGTSGCGAYFGAGSLTFDLDYINLYQKNEVITL